MLFGTNFRKNKRKKESHPVYARYLAMTDTDRGCCLREQLSSLSALSHLGRRPFSVSEYWPIWMEGWVIYQVIRNHVPASG